MSSEEKMRRFRFGSLSVAHSLSVLLAPSSRQLASRESREKKSRSNSQRQRAGSDRNSHGPAPLIIFSSSKGLTARSPARVSPVTIGERKMNTRAAEQSIDVSGIYDDETLHEYLWKTLGFPGYYGCNWDAFWDCIRSDEQSEMPTRLRVAGLAELRSHAPDSASKFEACLSDYAQELPDRSVVFE